MKQIQTLQCHVLSGPISQINSAQYLCNPIDRLYGCRHFASFECEYRGSTWLLKRIEGRACASSELYLRRLLYVVEGRPPPPPGKQTFIFFKEQVLQHISSQFESIKFLTGAVQQQHTEHRVAAPALAVRALSVHDTSAPPMCCGFFTRKYTHL